MACAQVLKISTIICISASSGACTFYPFVLDYYELCKMNIEYFVKEVIINLLFI